MKPAPFDYIAATSIPEAIEALRQCEGDGKFMAGGQSLMPVLAMRLTRPSLIVDLNRIPGLDYIARDGDMLHIGTLTRHFELLQQDHMPLLAEAAKWIGHAAIRSRGTFGGSIAHADPSAELPIVATALEATITTAGRQGTRDTPATDFFTGALETTLEDDEIVTAVRLPIPTSWGFAELSRRHGDFGMVTAVVTEVDGTWRIAIGGIAGVPYRPSEAESILNAGPLTDSRIAEASRAASSGLDFSTDIHGSADYRRAMTEEYTRRALAMATRPALIGA